MSARRSTLCAVGRAILVLTSIAGASCYPGNAQSLPAAATEQPHGPIAALAERLAAQLLAASNYPESLEFGASAVRVGTRSQSGIRSKRAASTIARRGSFGSRKFCGGSWRNRDNANSQGPFSGRRISI